MKREELKKLLDKYYAAEISEEEEMILRESFRDGKVAKLFPDEKEIFEFYSGEKQIPELSPGFNERLIASIDTESRGGGHVIYRRLILSVAGIAAGFLIIFGSWFFLMRNADPRDTFTDPELAYAEVMKILYDVSLRLNQGTSALEPVNRMQEIAGTSLSTLNRSTVKFEENLQILGNFTRNLEKVDLNNE